jgi:4-hydroxy-tetrahydrodipicolinate synthase
MTQPFDRARLDTVQLVPATPFSDDGRQVRYDELGRFVQSVAQAGISVLIPAAGTGEFHSLSADEVIGCMEATRLAAPNAVVIAPIGLSVAHAVRIAQRSAEIGAEALLLMPPIHPYLSDAGFHDYFQAIAEAVSLPILAYKKGPVPSDQLLTELGQAGRLAGVKYAVNDLDAFTRFADANRGRLGLYCGTAERFAPFFHLAGATGYTSGLGNIVPRLTLSMQTALQAGNYSESMRLLSLVRPIEDFRAMAGDSYNITAIKAGLNIAGWNFGPPRPPQRQLSSEELQRLRSLVEPMLASESKLR